MEKNNLTLKCNVNTLNFAITAAYETINVGYTKRNPIVDIKELLKKNPTVFANFLFYADEYSTLYNNLVEFSKTAKTAGTYVNNTSKNTYATELLKLTKYRNMNELNSKLTTLSSLITDSNTNLANLKTVKTEFMTALKKQNQKYPEYFTDDWFGFEDSNKIKNNVLFLHTGQDTKSVADLSSYLSGATVAATAFSSAGGSRKNNLSGGAANPPVPLDVILYLASLTNMVYADIDVAYQPYIVTLNNNLLLISTNNDITNQLLTYNFSKQVQPGFPSAEYTMDYDVTTKQLVLMKNGTKVQSTLVDLGHENCNELGITQADIGQCNSLLMNCKTGDVNSCLRSFDANFKLSTFDVDDINSLSSLNPLSVSSLLDKLQWPQIFSVKDKVTTRKYVTSYEKFKEFLQNKNVKLDDVDPKTQKFLVKCAGFINASYDEILNNKVKKVDNNTQPTADGVLAKNVLSTPIPWSNFRSNSNDTLKVMSQLMTPTLLHRTNSYANQLLGSRSALPPFGLGNIRFGQGGGGDEGSQFTELIKYYDTSITRIREAFVSAGKKLHPDVDAKIQKALQALQESNEAFSSQYNLINDYRKINHKVNDQKVVPTEEEMKRYVDAFKGTVQTLTSNELNVMKIVSTLQKSVSEVFSKLASGTAERMN